MFDGLLVHPSTKNQLVSFVKKPSHAVLLTGARGAGKITLALALAGELLSISVDKLPSHPGFTLIQKREDKQDIPIDDIRALRHSLRLKQPGMGGVRRVVIIDGAHQMNAAAQNALLKSLEEPSQDTVFILTAYPDRQLLPTVLSRTQVVAVRAVGLKSAEKYFGRGVETEWTISRGASALLTALVNDGEHELRASIDEAKSFLKKDAYQRQIYLSQMSRDRRRMSAFLDSLGMVIKALTRVAAQNNREAQLKKLLAANRLILQSSNDMEASVSPKLVAIQLTLGLSV